jgi:hypothetical protein
VVHRIVATLQGHRETRAPASSAESSQAGIAVPPGEHLVIVFSRSLPRGEARVVLTDSDDVVVRTLDGATFTSDADRLLIDPERPASRFDIGIPRTAPLVEIKVGSRRIFLKDGSGIRADVAQSEDQSYRLVLE